MLTTRKGLLVALVFLLVTVAVVARSDDAGARIRSSATTALQSPRVPNAGSTTESGEPDVGQTGRQSSQQSSVQRLARDPRGDRWRRDVWVRWTGWIWMVRPLGARF
jgi:hypothetical protein